MPKGKPLSKAHKDAISQALKLHHAKKGFDAGRKAKMQSPEKARGKKWDVNRSPSAHPRFIKKSGRNLMVATRRGMNVIKLRPVR